MRALALVVAASGVGLVAGCSLPRAVIAGGSGFDAGLGGIDAGMTGVDTGMPTPDGGTVPVPDTGIPPADGGTMPMTDAWVMPGTDAGGIHCTHDGDCPPDEAVLGACVYADDCATTGAMSQTTTHYTCDSHACTPHVTTSSAACSRETDGTPCGTITCGPCSATACGATGTQGCNGPMCAGGACSTQMTNVACSTPDDMCGSPPPWGPCHANFSGPCTQERIWSGCVLGGCTPFVGHTDSRTCTAC